MAKVFISYRRTDSAAISGRIYDHLVAKFRRKNVFKDVDNIPAGVNFGAYIQESLRECVVMLVVIGHNWLDARAPDGGRRLDDPHDWVRVEIETALALHLTIIPLLVEDASIPHAMDLPESLREIPALNALVVRNDPDFAHDMERVIAAVEHVFAARPANPGAGFPGLFHRGASSQPARERPAVDQPGQAEPVMPPPMQPVAGATPTVATITSTEDTPMTDMVAAHPQPLDPVKQPPVVGKAHAQRRFLAVLAAALIVVSLAVLLARMPSINVQAGVAKTQTAETSATRTSSASAAQYLEPVWATETANTQLAATAVAPSPLNVPAPGQDCVQEGMKGFWQSRSGTQYACKDTYTRVTATAEHPGTLTFDFRDTLTGVEVSVDSNYTVSMQMSNLSGNGGVNFDVQGSPEIATPTSQQPDTMGYYTLQVQPSGRWVASLERCHLPSDPCTKHELSGSINITQSHTLAFAFQGSRTVAVLLDGIVQGRYDDLVVPRQASVNLGLYCDSGTSQVDFSNFSIGAS